MNDNTKPGGTDPRSLLWCIATTSPGRTLNLMASLAAAGIEAWTPKQTQVVKRPRSTITFERDFPIAPTFVFVRAGHVRDLAEAEAMTVNPHPHFAIFRHDGRIPLIADHEIEGLRAEEARGQAAIDRLREQQIVKERRKRRHRLVMGQRVKFSEQGVFAGMTGTVEKGGDRFVLGAFGQSMRMKIATWLLSPDEVDPYHPVTGAAA